MTVKDKRAFKMSVLIYKEKKRDSKKKTRILKAKDQKNITSISLCP